MFINCVECYTARLLYEHIINSLFGELPCTANEFVPAIRCDNMNDFVRTFKKQAEDMNMVEKRIVLVCVFVKIQCSDVGVVNSFWVICVIIQILMKECGSCARFCDCDLCSLNW